ncbi:MAG: ROK family protein [Tannerellaceae bacterium]|nr:ROK family protein [Tannerellaceae bacterium]
MNKYTIAIDLGGTIVKIGLLQNGHLLNCACLDSRLTLGLASNLPRIQEQVNGLLERAAITSDQLTGIGLAFPGLVNPLENQVISTNEKYDDACGFDLNEWIKERWNVPLYMDNDARLAVVGEWCAGAAQGKNNVVMMTLGTGIGTGVIIDGSLLYGQHFQAGSLGGHFVVDYQGRRCSCGNQGCVESLASSFFLPVIIQQHASLSPDFKKQGQSLSFKDIFRMADEKNPDAILLRNECLDIWSAAVITYIHAYDPEVVVMGGGVLKSKEIILPYIREKVDQYAWCPSGRVEIVTSCLEENAALLGLDYCIKQKLKKESCHDRSII